MSSEKHIARLQEAGGSEIERRLLASAADDEMSEEKYRALVQWSAGASAAAEATQAAAAWKLPFVKGLGLLALAAASVGVFDYLSSTQPDAVSVPQGSSKASSASVPSVPSGTEPPEALPAPMPADTAEVVPVVTPNELRSAPTATATATPSPAPSARSVAKQPVADDVSLGEQMTFIDSARARLRQGDPRTALTVLDEYERRYPKPAFREEATVLRVSAHAKAGDVAEARRLGGAFLSTHPAELYSRRVEAIVRSLEPRENSQ